MSFLNGSGATFQLTSDADSEDVVIVLHHWPHQTRILFCSDTSSLCDWDLDLQTPDIMRIF